MSDPIEWVDETPSKLNSLMVWAFEIISEALGSGLLVVLIAEITTAIHGESSHSDLMTRSEVGRFVFLPLGILFLFFTSGYAVTTCLCRLLWRGKASLIPLVCASLYILHAEFLFTSLMEPPSDWLKPLVIVFPGGLLTYGCVFLGNRVLRKYG